MNIKGSRLAVASVALVAFGAASAANLGGVASASVGSSEGVVASCDVDGVSMAYGTAYSEEHSRYLVVSLTIDRIAPNCLGQTLTVALKGTGGTSLATDSTAVADTSETITGLTIPAEDLESASVVIY